MQESTKKKWGSMAVVLLSVFGSFAALMYLSINTFSSGSNPSSPFFRFQQKQDPSLPTQSSVPPVIESSSVSKGWVKIQLLLNRDIRVGNAVLTYQGLSKRSTFRLDAVIPDLDPQYSYKRTFNIAEARKGFQVGGERFMLVSAGRYKMRLMHLIPAR